jgi:hypothetical protein
METSTNFTISNKLRKVENLHIVFWLFKDMSWCMLWRELGVIMIFPTLFVSIYLTLKTRSHQSELFHNISITFWILANSFWMISEFYGFDEKSIIIGLKGKEVAFVFFILGVLTLAWYYLLIYPKLKKEKAA